MGRYKTLAKNSTYVFIGNIGSKLIGFFMLPFYTSWLSVEEFGTTDLVTVYVTMLLPFVTFSLSDAIFVFPSNCDKKKQTEYLTSALFFVALSFAILAVIFFFIRYFYIFKENVFNTYIWYIFILMITSFLQGFTQQFCMALKKMFVFSFTGILLTFFMALFGFMMIPQYGIIGYLNSMIFANLVVVLTTVVVVRMDKYVRLGCFRKDLLYEMLKYTMPLIPNALMWWLIGSLNRVTMESYVGVYFIGLYAVANRIPSILTSLYSPLTNAWKLSVVQEYRKEGFSSFYSNVGRLLIMTISLGTAIIGILSEPLIWILTSSEFHVAWIYSPILIISLIFIGLGSAVDPLFLVVKKSQYYLWSSVIGAAIGLILNFSLIPIVGIWGAVISLVGAQIGINVTRLYFSEKIVKLSSKLQIYIYVVLAILANLLLVVLHNYYISSLVLALLLLYYYILNKNQIKPIFNKVKQNYVDKRNN